MTTDKVSTGYPIYIGDQVFLAVKSQDKSGEIRPYLLDEQPVSGTVISISETKSSIRVRFENGVEMSFKRIVGLSTYYSSEDFYKHWERFDLTPPTPRVPQSSGDCATPKPVAKLDYSKYPQTVYLVKDANHLALLNLPQESSGIFQPRELNRSALSRGITFDRTSSTELEDQARRAYNALMKAASIAKALGR